jgi:TatD DNase family protein
VERHVDTTPIALYSTVGVHPTRCKEFDTYAQGPEAYLAALTSLATDAKTKHSVIAIGEAGLDYDRLQFCDKKTQQKYFIWQFQLAKKTQLPMFLHNRNTEGDFLRIITKYRKDFTTGVVHSFDGSVEELQALLQLDLYIGINGCSLKTPERLAVAAQIPLDRLCLETDAPWCGIKRTHAGYDDVKTTFGKQVKDSKYIVPETIEQALTVGGVKNRNEPCTMVSVLEVMAVALNVTQEVLKTHAYNNSMRLFFPHQTPTSTTTTTTTNAAAEEA